ncbi:MAG: UvrD-helicase domain-containing protein [Candidatus Falkowbacteria bacterium]
MSQELLDNLNNEQQAAVSHVQGPLLIVAGAGTGKTTVITKKIAYLIEHQLAKPEEILALTFTDKAAGEMEERVDKLLPLGYFDLWINTFHGFAERIIKQHGLDIGLPTQFKLLNEFEQWMLVNRHLAEFDLNYYRPAGNPTKFIHALLKHFSRLKDEDITPKDYLTYVEELEQDLDNMLGGSKHKGKSKKAGVKSKTAEGEATSISQLEKLKLQLEIEQPSDEILKQEVRRIKEIGNAYHRYHQLLLDEGSLDFGDLINYCLKLFKERPLILERYRQQFKYVLVDEFQDTNWAQYELVRLLAEPQNNLIVVGDDDQSIYRFRGASMSNILQFKKDYPTSAQVVLTQNYRSRQNILDTAYEFIKLNNPNRLECQLGQGDDQGCIVSKELSAAKDGQGEVAVIKGRDAQDETVQVVNKIIALAAADEQLTWNDFAILVRANDTAKEFCAALEQAGIPYIFLASRGLYTKPVVMDITAYFKLLDDYHESKALYRVLTMPIFNFGYVELSKLTNAAYKKSWSLFETLRHSGQLNLGAETDKKIYTVLTLISNHSKLAREKRAFEILSAFINESGYMQYLIGLGGQASREALGFLNQFAKRIETFESASDDRSVKAFMQELEMEINAGESGSLAPDWEAGPEAVKVMTVHAAKGLEFEHVFIVGMVDKRFPAIERRDPIQVPVSLAKEILPAGDTHTEEERRLFYVAMTRAKQGLFFSWSPDYGGARPKKPSRFLGEARVLSIKEAGTTASELQPGEQKIKPVELRHQAIAFTPPRFFSFTQLAAFENCPYQYHFAHILHVPVRGKGVFSFGKTMHSVMQKLFELIREKRGLGQAGLFGAPAETNPKIEFKEVLKLYQESWIDDWYSSKKQKEEYRLKGEGVLREFYDQYHTDWPDNRYTESGFFLKLRDGQEYFSVRGMIDRVDQIEGGLKIIDYKTGTPKQQLVFEDKQQLLIYQLAAKELFTEPVKELAYYYLENNQEVGFLGTDKELAKIEEQVVNTVREIKKGQFGPTPSPLCRFCDFFEICEFRQN